jgi:hypothetical protein
MTRLALHFGAMALPSLLESQMGLTHGHETIWNSDKFAADERPDWVKSILRGGHNVTAFLDENGRWYFEPTTPNEELPVGYTINLYKGGEKIPAIWNGNKFIDLRSDDGKKLYDETGSVRAV